MDYNRWAVFLLFSALVHCVFYYTGECDAGAGTLNMEILKVLGNSDIAEQGPVRYASLTTCGEVMQDQHKV